MVRVMPLPPDYRAAEVLAYHGRDPASLSERVTGARIEKPLVVDGGPVLVTLEIAGDEARLSADRSLSDAAEAAIETMARRMLGLLSDPDAFEAHPASAALVGARRGLRIPLTATVFEALCWAVIGQQINLTFAAALRREMVDLAGIRHAPSGLVAHPGPAEVAAIDPAALASRRFSRAKARYLTGVAAAVAAGQPDLDALAGKEAGVVEAALVALPGIGPWTARYVLLRGFGHADTAPIGDSGLATGLQRLHGLDRRPTPAEQEAAMRAFAPHRSLATVHLWASLADQATPSGTKSRKPVTRPIRPSETVAKSVPPASAGPPP
ncbi:hypothetical protein OSH08_09800 [Kaistia geumhonensis]|uniref:DNA-3-methyladenine glycosylase II n=1 Tax=Kaistia geumhonensis TaxID=410839 RepID=A0ABU0M3G7_9HYPH|nr:hypothetical protein [Kaistia geumhonensis]MCX5479298.1 hypothetical protein [Kaistia geumhonensis]MDQ0515480.1 3-methyladenine DNA glycosylase/8-oxoguanine DNA glycosylase [Kaistia geumhonensis]